MANQNSKIRSRVFPHDAAAEGTIIGACLVKPSIIPDVLNVLSPNDFYRESHIEIMRALEQLSDKADLVTVSDLLRRKGVLEKAGGYLYLADLAAAIATTAAWKHWAEIIRDLGTRRKFISQCLDSAESCFDLRSNTADLFLSHEEAIQEIEQGSAYRLRQGVHISSVYTPERMLHAYREHLEDLKKNRFVTGIRQIDRLIRGVAGGEVLIILGRAGTVKTGLLQNLLKGYVNHSAWKAVFFSIEMPVEGVTERYHQIIQGCTGREIEEIFQSSADGAEEHKARVEADFRSELRGLYIVPVKVGLSEAASYVSLIEKNFKTKIGLIGIDYLGLLKGKGPNQYEIVSGLARDIKTLAKLLNIPVIVLTQASRKGGTGETEISLDHARDSGAIEEGADFMLGLWQHERGRNEKGDPEYDVICKVLKNRKGPKNSQWVLDLDPGNFRIGHEARPFEPTHQGKASRGYDG